jgi:hypothetical protein
MEEVNRREFWVATKQQGRHSGLLLGLKTDLPNGQSPNLHGAEKTLCRRPNERPFLARVPSGTCREFFSLAQWARIRPMLPNASYDSPNQYMLYKVIIPTQKMRKKCHSGGLRCGRACSSPWFGSWIRQGCSRFLCKKKPTSASAWIGLVFCTYAKRSPGFKKPEVGNVTPSPLQAWPEGWNNPAQPEWPRLTPA